MARRRRRASESGVHHVMNRGVDRRPVFFTDRDRVEFGRQLADVHDRFGVETLAYCLMGNHYHLLLRAPLGALSTAMHQVGAVYTARTNLRTQRDGPLFRGRYHSIPVQTDTYLSWAARYIHRNPLDISGVTHPAGYRWSSYRAYLGYRQASSFLNIEPVLGLFGNDPGALADFTEGHYQLDLWGGHSIDDLIQLVEFEVRRDDIVFGDSTTSSPWQMRSLLVLVMDHVPGSPLAGALDQYLGFPNAPARSKAIKRAQSRLVSDPSMKRMLETMVGHLAVPHRA